MAQTLGIIDITWNGTKIAVEKGASLKIGGIKNNVVIVGRQVNNAQEYEASEITATTVLSRGMRWTDIWTTSPGELQVICDTGQTYTFSDAFLGEHPTITGGEGGKIQLKWMAGEPEEILNG